MRSAHDDHLARLCRLANRPFSDPDTAERYVRSTTKYMSPELAPCSNACTPSLPRVARRLPDAGSSAVSTLRAD